MCNVKLRDYQDADSTRIMSELNLKNNVMYQLPTGGGKSVVIQDIISKVLKGDQAFNPNKILIAIHKRELIFQMYRRLKKEGVDVGYLIGADQENVGAKVLVASIMTLTRDARLEELLKTKYDFVVIDEAHHARSSSYDKVLSALKGNVPTMRLFGVTATPYRNDNKELDEHFNVLIKGPSIQRLQSEGYLCKSKTYLMNLDNLEIEVKKAGKDYNISELSLFMRNPELVKKAVQMYKDKADGKQMLVFCVDIKHLKQVKQGYIDAGYTKIASITGNTPTDKRAEIVDKFAKGELDIIVSVETITEGVDLPNTKVIQFLRPTTSLVLYLQMGGRGLRPKDDKSDLIVLDIANVSKEHGVLNGERHWSLTNEDPNKKRKRKALVARKKGTLISDVDTISTEGLEIEEMDYEEFLASSAEGIEKAKKENNVLDEALKNLINKFGHKVTQTFNENFYFKPSDHYNNYNSKSVVMYIKEGSRDYFSLEYDKHSKTLNITEYRSCWGTNMIPKLEWWKLLGKMANKFEKSKDKLIKMFIEFSEEIERKEKLRINISEMQAKAKENKLKQAEAKIIEAMLHGVREFKLNKPIYPYHYNRNYGYSRTDSFEILGNKSRLYSTDDVRFEFCGTKKLKKEIILQMVVDGGGIQEVEEVV